MLQPGSILGDKYQLLSLLGKGGFGEVYAAENTWTGKRVAIKTLRTEIATDAVVLQRFYQEARAVCRIEHPNVVQVYDLGSDRELGVLFIVQELLQGRSLEAHLEALATPLDPREAVSLIVPVIEALGAAHRQGVVHRDVKPGNVLLATNAAGATVPKVIDFGISKIVSGDEPQSSRTHTGVAIGTPLYMSIEQARGDKSIDAQTDVWSVGVMLFEMVSGRYPFEGNNHNVVIANIIYQPPQRLDAMAPHLPRAFVDVVHRAFEKDRARRYATMGEFLAALRGCEAELSREHVVLPPKTGSVIPPRVAAETLTEGVELMPTEPPVSPSRIVPSPSTPPVSSEPPPPARADAGVDRSTQTNWSGQTSMPPRRPSVSPRVVVAGAMAGALAIAAIAASSLHGAPPATASLRAPTSPRHTPASDPAVLAAPSLAPVAVTSPAPSAEPAATPSTEPAVTPSPSAEPDEPPSRHPSRGGRRGAHESRGGHRARSGLDIDDSFNPRRPR